MPNARGDQIGGKD